MASKPIRIVKIPKRYLSNFHAGIHSYMVGSWDGKSKYETKVVLSRDTNTSDERVIHLIQNRSKHVHDIVLGYCSDEILAKMLDYNTPIKYGHTNDTILGVMTVTNILTFPQSLIKIIYRYHVSIGRISYETLVLTYKGLIWVAQSDSSGMLSSILLGTARKEWLKMFKYLDAKMNTNVKAIDREEPLVEEDAPSTTPSPYTITTTVSSGTYR